MNKTPIVGLLTVIFLAIATVCLMLFASLFNEVDQLRNAVASDLNYLSIKIDKLSNDATTDDPAPLADPEYGAFIMVSRVIDGDTIELANGDRLRYIGIDTPEKNDPRKPVQCFSNEASEKNKELVEGKMVKFYKDVNTRDKYQRLLGYVYLEDGTFVNLEMVKQGYAFSYSYPPDISKQDQFLNAEKVARETKLGLWAECTVSTTNTNRSETNAINNTNNSN